MTLGERLKMYRRQTGLSQEQSDLAKQLYHNSNNYAGIMFEYRNSAAIYRRNSVSYPLSSF